MTSENSLRPMHLQPPVNMRALDSIFIKPFNFTSHVQNQIQSLPRIPVPFHLHFPVSMNYIIIATSNFPSQAATKVCLFFHTSIATPKRIRFFHINISSAMTAGLLPSWSSKMTAVPRTRSCCKPPFPWTSTHPQLKCSLGKQSVKKRRRRGETLS